MVDDTTLQQPQFSVTRLGLERPALDDAANMVSFKAQRQYQYPLFVPYNNVNICRQSRFMLQAIETSDYPAACVATHLAFSWRHRGKVQCLSVKWFQEGRRLVSGTSSGELTIWNGVTFAFDDVKRLPLGGGTVTALEWASNGQRLYTGDSDGKVITLSTALNPIDNEPLEGLSRAVVDLSAAPQSYRLVGCAENCCPVIWDVETKRVEKQLRAAKVDTNSTTSLQWHPWLQLIAITSRSQGLHLWDPRTGTLAASVFAHRHSTTKVKWHIAGTTLVTGGKDSLLKLWDIRKLESLVTIKLPGNQPEPSSQERTATREAVPEPTALAWHPLCASLLTIGDSTGNLLYYDIRSTHSPLTKVRQAHGPKLYPPGDAAVRTIDWHPSGHALATTGDDRLLRFWSRTPPGSVSGQYIGAAKLCEVERTGGFSVSQYQRKKRRLVAPDSTAFQPLVCQYAEALVKNLKRSESETQSAGIEYFKWLK